MLHFSVTSLLNISYSKYLKEATVPRRNQIGMIQEITVPKGTHAPETSW